MKRFAGWLAAVMAVFVVMAITAYAEEKLAGDTAAVQQDTTIEGVVAVTRDGDRIKQVTLGEGDQKVCVCFSTDSGKKLADMNGKKVKVVGKLLQDKDGKKVIVVASFEEVKADAAK